MTAWIRDTVERAVSTWAQVFLGLLIAGWSGAVDLAVIQAAAWSALPAGLAVIKAALAAKVGGTVSPASFAKAPGAPE